MKKLNEDIHQDAYSDVKPQIQACIYPNTSIHHTLVVLYINHFLNFHKTLSMWDYWLKLKLHIYAMLSVV